MCRKAAHICPIFAKICIHERPNVIFSLWAYFFNPNNTTMKKKAKSFLSLFISCQDGCICQFKSDFDSEKDLWNLCLYAYEEYQKDVRFGQKKYHRYVADVLSYNVPIASQNQQDWQVHSMNISRLYELLDYRIDLVRKYFTKDEFTESDFEKMMNELLYWKTPFSDEDERNAEMEMSAGTFASMFTEQVYIGKLSSKQLEFITSFVNRIKLFTHEVTKLQMHQFFYCNLHDSVLQVNDLNDFAFFLDALREKKLIVNKWQKLIEEYRMVISTKDVYVSRTNLSSAINGNKEKKKDIRLVFSNFADSLVGR